MTVRLLHTSDWHVGKQLRGRSRADEHRAVLGEIAGVAAREAVDVVLVVGDLFESAAPAPEAEQIVYEALLELAATGATVVVVAGNHDNHRRLAAVRPLLHLGRVHVVPVPAPPDAGGVLDLTTRRGERLRLAALPFVSQRSIVRAAELMAGDAAGHVQQYAGRVQQVVAALCGGFDDADDAVCVLGAHLMVQGGVLGGGERDAHTVFEYAVPATAFPPGAHYVALGHLHRPQQVPGPCPIRYCGSPLQLDFGETGDTKAVLVVDATPATPAEVREVPLTAGRRLVDLAGTLDELEAHAAEGRADPDDPAAPWLRVTVRSAASAGLADRVRELFPTAVDVRVERPDRDAERPRPRRRGRSPHALFAEYLAEQGADDPRVLALFDELIDEALEGALDGTAEADR